MSLKITFFWGRGKAGEKMKAWEYPTPTEPGYDVYEEESHIRILYDSMKKHGELPTPGMSIEEYRIYFYEMNPINSEFVRIDGRVMRRKPLFEDYEEITEATDEYGRLIKEN